MNYGQLKSQVAARLHRTDLTSVIPEFIEAARVRLGADLRSLCNFTTGNLTSFVDGLTALPANLAAIMTVRDATGRPLSYIHPAEVEYNQGDYVYSVQGNDLLVPDAGATDVYTMTYWTVPAALVNDADISEGMAEWPSLWQYATLIEAALYLHDWDLYDRMVDAYQGTLASANLTFNLYGPGLRMIDSGRNIISNGSGL